MYVGGEVKPENLNFFGREVNYLKEKGYTIGDNGVATPSGQ